MELINFTENLPLLLNTTAISKFQNVRKEKMHWSPRAIFFFLHREESRKEKRVERNSITCSVFPSCTCYNSDREKWAAKSHWWNYKKKNLTDIIINLSLALVCVDPVGKTMESLRGPGHLNNICSLMYNVILICTYSYLPWLYMISFY